MRPLFGGVAQLAERFGRIEEARGSIPLTSTRLARTLFLAFAISLGACSGGGSTTSTSAPPSTTTTTTSTTTVPSGQIQDDEYSDLIAVTEELRGLEFLKEPKIIVISEDEFVERVREDLEEEFEDIEADEAFYTLLGIIEPPVDLKELYLDLYGEQVAGFYDLEKKELVVPRTGESLSVLEKSTMVHELTHALADQHFGMWETMEALDEEGRFDAYTAYLSVAEGDAMWVQTEHMGTLSLAELTSLFEESMEVDSEVFDSAPLFITESLLFPYTTGLELVYDVRRSGGSETVDDLYLNPPESTEQVISKNLEEAVMSVPKNEVVLPGYELIYDADWGQAAFISLFHQVNGKAEFSGWGGDRMLGFFDGENAVVAFDVILDDAASASQFSLEMKEYLSQVAGRSIDEGSSSGEPWVCFESSGNRVVVVMADEGDAGTSVAQALGVGQG